LKFYKEDGVWEMVGKKKKILFIREKLMFNVLIKKKKRKNEKNLKDCEMLWELM
jgi:catalase